MSRQLSESHIPFFSKFAIQLKSTQNAPGTCRNFRERKSMHQRQPRALPLTFCSGPPSECESEQERCRFFSCAVPCREESPSRMKSFIFLSKEYEIIFFTSCPRVATKKTKRGYHFSSYRWEKVEPSIRRRQLTSRTQRDVC